MAILTTKKTKSKPPFYFVEGKGWRIEGKVKFGDRFIKYSKQWFPTYADAVNAHQSVVDERIKKEKGETRTEVSWYDFEERWIAYRRTKVKGASLTLDKGRLSRIFDPMFAKHSVAWCFKAERARLVQETVQSDNSSRINKNKILAMYLNMLEFASNREYLESDTDYRKCKAEISKISVVEEEEESKVEKQILSESQQEALLGAIVDPADKLLVLLLFETGMRVSEALALAPCDFDLSERVVSVTKTVSKDEFGNRKLYNRTKTPLGRRVIPLSVGTAAIVASYIKAFSIKGDSPMFPCKTGTDTGIMDYTGFRRRLQRYCKRADIPVVSPHCLRHTFATRLSADCHNDADRQARAYIMGHSVFVDEQTYTAHNQLSVAKELINKTH